MGAQDISWIQLLCGYLLIAIPLWVSSHYRLGLRRELLIAIGRMTIQLALVGLYLKLLFELNNATINLAWVIIMVGITAFTVLRRARLKVWPLFGRLFLAVALSVLAIELPILYFVLDPTHLFDAAYLIPIAGMLIGNTLADLVVSLSYFYTTLRKQIATYRFALANGATPGEALSLFTGEAIRLSLNRGIATTAVMGLVSLPGMMTGQVLGGSSPEVAIKYQILITIAILCTSTAGVFLSLWLTRQQAFDSLNNLRQDLFNDQ